MARRTSGGSSYIARGRKGADSETPHPFEVGPGPDAGTIQVVPGTVNEFIPTTVDGYGEEDWIFGVPEDSDSYLWLRAEIDGNGLVTAAELELGEVLPDQPEGDEETGSAPEASYRLVAKLSREEDGPVKIVNYLLGSQWVTCTVSRWNCSLQTVRVIWAETVAAPL